MRPCPACGEEGSRSLGEKNEFALARCRSCGTLRTADIVHDEYGAGYAEYRDPAPFLAGRLDDIVATFAPFRKSGRLLDVGFGAGDLLAAAQRGGWTVSGVELAEAAVDRARMRGVNAVCSTLRNAPFDEGMFDVIVAIELLEHVTDTQALLQDIFRILRPGGLFFATTPHGLGLSSRLLGTAWSVINPPNHVQLFSIRGIRIATRLAGFGALRIAAEGVNPAEIIQVLRGKRISSRERIDSGYELNEYLESSRGRQMLKRGANRVLSMLRLGDSLKIRAIRPL